MLRTSPCAPAKYESEYVCVSGVSVTIPVPVPGPVPVSVPVSVSVSFLLPATRNAFSPPSPSPAATSLSWMCCLFVMGRGRSGCAGLMVCDQLLVDQEGVLLLLMSGCIVRKRKKREGLLQCYREGVLG